jgi:probable phosphoglycerate mutase
VQVAKKNYAFDPNSIQIAYANGTPVGMLQLDFQQEADQGVGRVPFLYIRPDYRSNGFGVQLLGQAVYTFRSMGRDRLRLRCAPENNRAKQFYQRHGFCKIGEEPGGIDHLDTMELYIGIELK